VHILMICKQACVGIELHGLVGWYMWVARHETRKLNLFSTGQTVLELKKQTNIQTYINGVVLASFIANGWMDD